MWRARLGDVSRFEPTKSGRTKTTLRPRKTSKDSPRRMRDGVSFEALCREAHHRKPRGRTCDTGDIRDRLAAIAPAPSSHCIPTCCNGSACRRVLASGPVLVFLVPYTPASSTHETGVRIMRFTLITGANPIRSWQHVSETRGCSDISGQLHSLSTSPISSRKRLCGHHRLWQLSLMIF